MKVKYARQTGTELPDGVLVTTLLNRTLGALQRHLRLNARTLQMYQQTRDASVEHCHSKLMLTSANLSSHGGDPPAPMDIGFVGKGEGKGKKGKGKGKKGKGKGPHWSFFGTLKGKSKGKGKPQGKKQAKDFGSQSAAASANGRSSSSALSAAVCWTCGRTGHFSKKCPLNRVSALEETEE